MKDLERIEELAINIDMINGFVKKGALAAPSILRVVPKQVEVLEKYYNDDNKKIMIVRDCHKENSVEFNTFGRHCVEGTDEVLLIKELEKYLDGCLEVTKNSTNFVFGTNFKKYIDLLINLKRVVLMGCLSEVCVKNGGITLRNLFDEENRDIDIYVLEDAIDTFDTEEHRADIVTENAIRDMEANGIKRVKVKELIKGGIR